MNKCSYCGSEVSDYVTVCPNCGAKGEFKQESLLKTYQEFKNIKEIEDEKSLSNIAFILSLFSIILGYLLAAIAIKKSRNNGHEPLKIAKAALIIPSIKLCYIILYVLFNIKYL